MADGNGGERKEVAKPVSILETGWARNVESSVQQGFMTRYWLRLPHPLPAAPLWRGAVS